MEQKLVSAAARILNVHPRVVSRGIRDRRSLDEAPGTGYVKATRSMYRNAISNQAGGKITDWMHSHQATRVDNYRKHLTKVYFMDDRGNRAYVEHPAREMLFNLKTLWTLFSGTDSKCRPVHGFEPSSEWQEVRRMTRTPKRPDGIKGGPHLLTRYSCPCINRPKRSQCSCPYCSHFLETAHVITQTNWSRTSGPTPCDRCGRQCHRSDSLFRTFLENPIEHRTKMFCAPTEIARLNLIEPESGLLLDDVKIFNLHPKNCMHHKCTHCGWKQRFDSLPLLTAVFDEGGDDERQVQFRGCPYDCRPGTVQWNEFRKVEHGLCASGKPYVTDTWIPVEGTRMQLHGRMYEFYLQFWPHQWSQDLNGIVSKLQDRYFR